MVLPHDLPQLQPLRAERKVRVAKTLAWVALILVFTYVVLMMFAVALQSTALAGIVGITFVYLCPLPLALSVFSLCMSREDWPLAVTSVVVSVLFIPGEPLSALVIGMSSAQW